MELCNTLDVLNQHWVLVHSTKAVLFGTWASFVHIISTFSTIISTSCLTYGLEDENIL